MNIPYKIKIKTHEFNKIHKVYKKITKVVD